MFVFPQWFSERCERAARWSPIINKESPMPTVKTIALAAAGSFALTLAAGTASAATVQYTVTFEELNDSGVSGNGLLTYDDETNELTFDLSFAGLALGAHPMHIHGPFQSGPAGPGETPADAVLPTIAADTDGDGFIETAEGVPAYGDILLSLFDSPGSGTFMTSNPDGTMSYNVTFDLDNASIFGPSPATGFTYSMADLLPLVLREIVIHGALVADGAGGGSLELTGDNCPPGQSECFVGLLPVAAASIEPVPIPAAGLFFLTAGAGLFGARRMKKNKGEAATA
jgi:hypothetical protein